MKRWGSGERFLAMIDGIRAEEPDAAFRSSFIVGFPGETEADHDALLAFLDAAAARLGRVLPVLARGRHAGGDAARRGRRRARGRAAARVRRRAGADHAAAPRRARSAPRSRCSSTGATTTAPLVGRTHREAPEIDGVVRLDADVGPARRASCAAHVTERDRPRPRGQGHVSAARVGRKRRAERAGRREPARGIAASARSEFRSRDRHAGELRHDRAAHPRGADAPADRATRARRGSRSRCGSCSRAPTARRLARPPRRHDALGRVPRPARRQVPRDRRLLRARHPRRLLVGRRSPSSPCARSASRSTARSPARRGISLPARRLGKWKAFFQFLAVGIVLFPPTYEWATFHDIVLWIAVALTVVSGLDIVRRGLEAARAQRADAMRCDVLAIGTELLLGQIVDTNSSWIGEQLAAVGHRHVRAPQGGRQPRPHGRSACASCSTAPTPSSSAAGSAPPPTTSPARRSPR